MRPAEIPPEESLRRLLERHAESSEHILDPAALADADQLLARTDWAELRAGSPAWTALILVAALHRQRSKLVAESEQTAELLLAHDLLRVANYLASDEGPEKWPGGRPSNSVGLRILDHADRTGDAEAAARAAVLFQRAVSDAPAGDPHLATYLSNLGAANSYRYGRTAEEEALDAAVAAFRGAVGHAALDSADRPAFLANLGAALGLRYERTGSSDHLDEAIDLLRQALRAEPTDPNTPPAWASSTS